MRSPDLGQRLFPYAGRRQATVLYAGNPARLDTSMTGWGRFDTKRLFLTQEGFMFMFLLASTCSAYDT